MQLESSHKPAATKPLLIILSGPSGVGKDAVLARMKESRYPLKYIVTLTTRARRPQEKEYVDYHFVSSDEFEALVEKGQLLEHAKVYGNWYGVPRKDVEEALAAGQDVVVKVDVQGATNIKAIMPQSVAIFLTPPSKDDLLARLQQRKTESASELEVRANAAEGEFDRLSLFDYVVVSEWGQVDRVVGEIEAVIESEKCRPRGERIP